MEGWISLHRKILSNPIVCKDPSFYAIWSYLILEASHTDQLKIFNNEKITLKRGQLITGRKTISEQFGGKNKLSESKVQRVLETLEIEQMIEQQTSNKNRLITVLNYDYYQSTEQQNEQPLNNNRTTTEQPLNTNNNVIINNDIIKYKKKKKDSTINSTIEKSLEDSIDFKRISEYWNSKIRENSKMPKVNFPFSETRKSHIKRRIEETSIDIFYNMIDKAHESDFLCGIKTSEKKSNWVASFSWCIESPETYAKIIEGNYDNKISEKPTFEEEVQRRLNKIDKR